MNYFKFPTTVLIIDDDINFAMVVCDLLNSHGINTRCLAHTNSHDLLKNQNRYFGSIHQFYNNASNNKSIKLKNIYQMIYSYERFENVSTIILDFKMPTIEGTEIARRLTMPTMKRIVLSAEMESQFAIDTLNSGTIDVVINKGSDQFKQKLIKHVPKLMKKFFDNDAYRCDFIRDEVLQKFVETFIAKIDSPEYYLFSKNGSYLFLDNSGKLSGLQIFTSQELDIISNCMSIEYSDTATTKLLKNKSIMPVLFSDEMDFARMKDLFVECNKINGTLATYYYAFVQDDKHFALKSDKIKSYQSFLANQSLKRDLLFFS